MNYYFGFHPSQDLSDKIDKAYALIEGGADVRYDTYRDQITHMVNQELLDAMLGKLIEAMPQNSERRAHLVKANDTIHVTVDKLINTLLSPADNAQVLPSFEFLDRQVLFRDTDGQRRISVPLDDTFARELLACIERVQQGHGEAERDNLTRLFTQLVQSCLQHFMGDFTKTLPLGMIKRRAIPVAEGVINKVVSVALQRLIPQMPQDALARFSAYYSTLIFQAQSSQS